MRFLGQAGAVGSPREGQIVSPIGKVAQEVKVVESNLKSGLLELLLIGIFLVVWGKLRVPDIVPGNVDTHIGTPSVFALIVIAQGLLGQLGLPQIPKRIEKLQKNPIVRFCFIVAIAYAATADIELSIVATGAFALVMHLVRTPEERAKVPYFV